MAYFIIKREDPKTGDIMDMFWTDGPVEMAQHFCEKSGAHWIGYDTKRESALYKWEFEDMVRLWWYEMTLVEPTTCVRGDFRG